MNAEANAEDRVDTTYAGMRALRARAKARAGDHPSYSAALEASAREAGHPQGWGPYQRLVRQVRGIGSEVRERFARDLEVLLHDAAIATTGELRRGDVATWEVDRDGKVSLKVLRPGEVHPDEPEAFEDNTDIEDVGSLLARIASAPPCSRAHSSAHVHEVTLVARGNVVEFLLRTCDHAVLVGVCRHGCTSFEWRHPPRPSRLDSEIDAMDAGRFTPFDWGFEAVGEPRRRPGGSYELVTTPLGVGRAAQAAQAAEAAEAADGAEAPASETVAA